MKANASPYIRRTRGLLLSNAALSLWKYVEAATRSDAHTVKKGLSGVQDVTRNLVDFDENSCRRFAYFSQI